MPGFAANSVHLYGGLPRILTLLTNPIPNLGFYEEGWVFFEIERTADGMDVGGC